MSRVLVIAVALVALFTLACGFTAEKPTPTPSPTEVPIPAGANVVEHAINSTPMAHLAATIKPPATSYDGPTIRLSRTRCHTPQPWAACPSSSIPIFNPTTRSSTSSTSRASTGTPASSTPYRCGQSSRYSSSAARTEPGSAQYADDGFRLVRITAVALER